jgi:Gpi18-like mannosyltransferase
MLGLRESRWESLGLFLFLYFTVLAPFDYSNPAAIGICRLLTEPELPFIRINRHYISFYTNITNNKEMP